MTRQHPHIDQVLTVISSDRRIAGNDPALNLIHRSWLRCAHELGLDPMQHAAVQVETSGRIRERKQRSEDYMRVARAGMEQLYKHVVDLGYSLLLTDADGITLDCIGNDSWDSIVRRAGLIPGANWSESVAGTNGIGTCIAEQVTLTCHRDDHFFTSHIGLSCTASPLFDPGGRLMGILDVSALSSPNAHESQHLVRHLTSLYGRMIEDAMFLGQFRDHWIVRLGMAAPLVDVSGELILAVDADGIVVAANTGARRSLRRLDAARGGESAGLIGSPLTEVFRGRIDNAWQAALRNDGSAEVAVTAWDDRAYHASLNAPRHKTGKPAPGTDVERVPSARRHSQLAQLGGHDAQMAEMIDRATRLVDKPVNILIQGETGTGKEVLARALHRASERCERDFVAINCASIPEALIESELFGYLQGTFTGARQQGMKGLIHRADGGTLFLDEIGDMPLTLQTRLLRVLSEHEILPLGAQKPIQVDLKVIAASHHDLRKLIAAGSFREDLYYRLCGATLFLPPLRMREDLGFLIDKLLGEESAATGHAIGIEPTARELLMLHDWPGNIRQLRNVIRLAVSLVDDGDRVLPEHLPVEILGIGNPPASSPAEDLSAAATGHDGSRNQPPASHGAEAAEAQRLLQALRRHQWNVTAAARSLDISRATIYRHMKRMGIVSPVHSVS